MRTRGVARREPIVDDFGDLNVLPRTALELVCEQLLNSTDPRPARALESVNKSFRALVASKHTRASRINQFLRTMWLDVRDMRGPLRVIRKFSKVEAMAMKTSSTADAMRFTVRRGRHTCTLQTLNGRDVSAITVPVRLTVVDDDVADLEEQYERALGKAMAVVAIAGLAGRVLDETAMVIDRCVYDADGIIFHENVYGFSTQTPHPLQALIDETRHQ